jgi:hypothetical protein
MQGKINKIGHLELRRKDVWRKTCCPYTVSMNADASKGMYCGDWCPHFGEPNTEGELLTLLEICQGTAFYFLRFKDEREEGEEECRGK